MIIITSVRLHPPTENTHQAISRLRWHNATSQQTGESTRESLVDWINSGGDARVAHPQHTVRVVVVDADPPYLRTTADGVFTNNLLSLPRF